MWLEAELNVWLRLKLWNVSSCGPRLCGTLFSLLAMQAARLPAKWAEPLLSEACREVWCFPRKGKCSGFSKPVPSSPDSVTQQAARHAWNSCSASSHLDASPVVEQEMIDFS